MGWRTTVGNTTRMIFAAAPCVTIPPSRLRPQARPERPDLSGWEVGQFSQCTPGIGSHGAAMEHFGIALSHSALSRLYVSALAGVKFRETP